MRGSPTEGGGPPPAHRKSHDARKAAQCAADPHPRGGMGTNWPADRIDSCCSQSGARAPGAPSGKVSQIWYWNRCYGHRPAGTEHLGDGTGKRNKLKPDINEFGPRYHVMRAIN